MAADPRTPLRLVQHFRTGHPAIDADHQRLARTLSRAGEAIDAAPAEEPLTHTLLDLVVEALERHLQREEALLGACRYPKLDEHSARHADLRRRARAVRVDCRGADAEAMRRCFDQMTALFVEEVVAGDHAFMSWLEECGEAERRPPKAR